MSDRFEASNRYLTALANEPLLPTDVENELARRAKRGDADARRDLLRGNFHHVATLAMRFGARSNVPIEELVSAGMEGLCQALQKYEPKRGHRYITYAAWWIRVHMNRALQASWTASLNSRNASVYRMVKQAVRQGLGVDDTVATVLARYPTMREDTVKALVARSFGRDVSLEAIDNPEKSGFLASSETLPDEACEEKRELARRKDAVRSAMARLSEREQMIVRRRAMADEEDVATLEACAQPYGVSRERVRQIEREAMAKLRRALLAFKPADARPERVKAQRSDAGTQRKGRRNGKNAPGAAYA